MPNYEFQCEKCELNFRKSLPYGSKELPKCPKCLGKTRKIITPPTVLFKGSGFYKTDSAPKPVAATPAKAETPKTETAKPADKPKEAGSQ